MMKNSTDSVQKQGNEKKKRKNRGKKKKNGLKTALENPFELTWPTLKPNSRADIYSSLEQTFSGMLEVFTPLTSQEAKTPGSESLDDILKKGKEQKRIGLDNKSKVNGLVVFGFNSVMRGLEKDRIICVLVNAEAQPEFLIKMFIPVCKMKKLPLISIIGLPALIRKYFNIKNAMVLGITKSACEIDAPFSDLYARCCTAVEYESKVIKNDVPQVESTPLQAKGSKITKNQEPVISKLLNCIHLKRDDISTRVFKPPKAETDYSGPPQKTVSNAVKEPESFYFLEMGGIADKQNSDHSGIADKQDSDDSGGDVSISFSNKKHKLSSPEFAYVPAKVKRVKPNPNRK